jgi:undecaprenyl-diphosphatase
VKLIDGVSVSVEPRHRERSASDVLRLLLAVLLLGAGLVVHTWGRNTVLGAEADIVLAYERLPNRLAELINGLAWIIAAALPTFALLVLLLMRQFRRAAALFIGGTVALLAMVALDSVMNERSVIDAVETQLGHPINLDSRNFATSPLLASVVAMVVIASSWLSQRWQRALWGGVVVLTLLRVVASGSPPLDLIIAVAVGLALGSLALVVFGSPSTDPSGGELVRLLRNVGDPAAIVQTRTNGRSASPLSYLVTMRDGTLRDLRLRTPHDRSADLLERLWRYVRLRSIDNDAPFSTLSRRVEHEALALTMAAKAGARVHDVRAMVASSTGCIGLLLDHIPGAVPATDDAVTLDRDHLVDTWRQVQLLHRRRIAHRSLTMAHVSVVVPPDPGSDPGSGPGSATAADSASGAATASGGDDAAVAVTAAADATSSAAARTIIDGFDRTRLTATDRDLALDTAQLLVDSALRVGTEPAIDAATAVLGTNAVVRAVPFLQPPALPGATRRSLRANRAVLDEIRTAVQRRTDTELAPLDRLDRIRPRTAVSIVALAIAFYALLPQLAQAEDTAQAAASANWWWLAPIVAGSAATYFFAALAFVAAAPGPLPYFSVVRLQVASSFVSQVAPANTGGLAAGVRFLQRVGFEPAAATTAVGLNAIGSLAVHLSLTAAFIAWTGTSGVGGFSLPQANTLLLVIAVVVSASGLVAGLVPSIRRRLAKPLIAHARTAGRTLATVVTDPLRVLELLAGATGTTLCYTLTLAAAIQAFGGGISFPQIGAAFLVSSALASAAPTPGGLGALEAALVTALTGYGMGDTAAISAVLTYRLATFWLPVVPGWLMFQQMQRRGEL